jgi:hypothetical protein
MDIGVSLVIISFGLVFGMLYLSNRAKKRKIRKLSILKSSLILFLCGLFRVILSEFKIV